MRFGDHARMGIVIGLVIGACACALGASQGAFEPCLSPLQDSVHDESSVKKIDQLILRETLGQFWGVVLVGDASGIVYSRGFGVANRELAPIDDRTLFDIGSISKAFTAAAVLRLELEGKVRLDAPIALYLNGVPEHAGKITIAQLLGHTSGVMGGASMRGDSAEEVIRSVLETPLGFEPGTRMAYSNAGYFLLAALIEKMSERTYEEYVRDEVLKIAGMDGSTLIGLGTGQDDVPAGAVVAARVDEQMGRRSLATDEPYSYSWGYKGAGGVVASARDLFAFDRALRGDGLLDAMGRERMFRAGQGGYGLGWFVTKTQRGWRHEHSGGVWGFSSEMIRHEDGTVIIVLTNGRNDPVGLAKKIEAALMPELSDDVYAVVNTAGRQKGEHGVIRVEGSATAHAGAVDGRVRIEFSDGTAGTAALVEMRVSRARALAIAGEIDTVANADDAAGKTGGTLMVGTMRYSPDAQGKIELPTDVMIVVMPGYNGVGEGGRAISDQRPTIVVMDNANAFWPVILTLDHGDARAFAKGLREAGR
jgi:CubicO group peptidase (beta-lactamase class C family)